MPKLKLDFSQQPEPGGEATREEEAMAKRQPRIPATKKPARKPLPKPAAGAKTVRVDLRSNVYMRNRTHTYLWLRDGYKFGYFLSMDSGKIEVVKVDIVTETLEPATKTKPAVTRDVYRVWENREITWDLVPHPYDFRKAVEKYHTSTVGRTAAAEREMRSILGLPQLADDVTDEDLQPEQSERQERAAKPAKERAARPAKAEKGPGGYTLQELCAELKKDPTEARKALRAAKVEKPGGRWEWPNVEAAAAVRAILEKI